MTNRIFLIWANYQRRAEVLAPKLGLEIRYFYYPWEDYSVIKKGISYILKFFSTIYFLFEKSPKIIFITLAPTPLLYCVSLYCWITKANYVCDCHNSMTYGRWIKWPFVRVLLKEKMIVHNEFVASQVKKNLNLSPMILQDSLFLPAEVSCYNANVLKKFGLKKQKYIILPWRICHDEPLAEIIEVAHSLSKYKFVLTGLKNKLPRELLSRLPVNLILTDFLDKADFEELFVNSALALVLTTKNFTQLCGMVEAISYNIPAVVSDNQTTRLLYLDGPVYVENQPNEIANGIEFALDNRDLLLERMKITKKITEEKINSQIRFIQQKFLFER